MKKINLFNILFFLIFSIVLSTSVIAQEKPVEKHPSECTCENCSSKDHKCSEDCSDGCKHAHAMKDGEVKHVCTEECHAKGCDFVKAKEARAALDVNEDGKIYECPMKCDASDVAGECLKCGMELKEVSVTES